MAASVIEEIKERLDIVDVIGGYVTLQKAGRTFKALCPFHSEKTPSFVVYPESGTWRCFGACGTGGDVISFVQKRENLDFREALRLLGQRAGVDVDRDRNPEVANRFNRLREINTLAASFFHHQLLHTPGGESARAYLQRRAVNAETIERFQLGVAPSGWDKLLTYLQQRGFSAEELDTAGLVIHRDDGGYHDRFRERLMIPICDNQGRVIGFGGRLLGDGEPKYLNSPQTPLFDKSEVIFALDLAKRAMRSRDQVVLVEGYMDVISAHQRGFENVVAAMGTAITPQQLRRLSQYTPNPVFALDADAAGFNATLRSLQVAREALADRAVPVPTARGAIRYEQRLTAVIKIAAMPPGQDPDDVVRSDPALWQRLIDNAKPLVDFLIDHTASEEDLKSARGKSQLVERLLPVLSEVDNPIERRHYVGRVAMMAGVTERELDRQLEMFARNASRVQPRAVPSTGDAPPVVVPPVDGVFTSDEEPPLWGDAPAVAAPTAALARTDSRESHILAFLLAEPEVLLKLDHELAKYRCEPITIDDFEEAANRAIFDAQQEFLYSGDIHHANELLDRIDPALHSRLTLILTDADTLLSRYRLDQRLKYLVDSLLQLRLERLRARKRQIDILLRSSGEDEQEIERWSREIVRLIAESHNLSQIIKSRSHHTRWFNEPGGRTTPPSL